MLKVYAYKGRTYQFEAGKQPASAVEVKAEEPKENKAKQPANKAKKPKGTK